MERKENEIKQLLQKYYAGETSREEDDLLEVFYGNAESPFDPSPERRWFVHLTEVRKGDASEGFDERVTEILKETGRGGSVQWRWMLKVAAALAGIVMVFLVYQFYNSSSWIEKRTTESQCFFQLPDSTRIWLNAKSVLRYREPFDERTREVWLEGEGYFEVTPNPSRSFQVHTHQTLTEVLGTSFNMRDDNEGAEIAVTSGKVTFGSTNEKEKKIMLISGNGGIFDGTTQSLRKLEKTDPNTLAWKTQRLEFADTPLEDALNTMRKYFKVDIRVENPALLKCRFRGIFRQASLKEILDVMEFSMGIQSQNKNGTYFLSGRGC